MNAEEGHMMDGLCIVWIVLMRIILGINNEQNKH